jgi:secreted trypsin-like serine protease
VIPDDVCPRFDKDYSKYTAAHCSGTGGCVGDFGGPLICVEKNSRTGVDEPVVRGIMSHTKGCSNKPMIYTDTQGYLDWIRQKTAVIAAQERFKIRKKILTGYKIIRLRKKIQILNPFDRILELVRQLRQQRRIVR